MIIRARPRYLEAADLELEFTRDSADRSLSNRLYFNYGRSALAFVLGVLKQRSEKPLTVGVQSFNCGQVLEAIIETGNRALVFDVQREHFSINYIDLFKHIDLIDVLLLTHYQGLMHPEYPNIADLCRQHHVVLIDDAAQTEFSSYQGQGIGTRAQFKLESYAFDKPFTTYEGGALVLNESVPEDMREELLKAYGELEIESEKKAETDIRALGVLFKLTSADRYRASIPYALLHRFLSLGFSAQRVGKIFERMDRRMNKAVISMIGAILGSSARTFPRIAVLHPGKVALLEYQFSKPRLPLPDYWEPVLKDLQLTKPDFRGMDIHWNRLSILDHEDDRLKKWCVENGIEAGNFNWPVPLHVSFMDHPACRFLDDYSESEFCSRHVVNLPIWMETL